MSKFFVCTTEYGISVVKVDSKNTVWWLGDGLNDVQYLSWVAKGNTAEEWVPQVTEGA